MLGKGGQHESLDYAQKSSNWRDGCTHVGGHVVQEETQACVSATQQHTSDESQGVRTLVFSVTPVTVCSTEGFQGTVVVRVFIPHEGFL